MVMHVYGQEEAPVVLMLHPMGITAEKMYERIASSFKGEYYFLIPDMGNHGDDTSDFTSAEEEALQIYKYLRDHKIADLALLYGASMGAVVALRLIGYRDLTVRNMYLDGAPVARLSLPMRKIFGPVLVWQKGIYAKNDREKLSEFIERWGDDINDHMAECFKKFSKKTIGNIADVCVRGNLVSIPEELQVHTYMEWGKDELYAGSSPALVRDQYPKVHICVRPGYNHCEYMMKKTERYVSFMEKIIANNNFRAAAGSVGAGPDFDPKVRSVTEEEIEEIGHAFGYYDYGDEDGMVKLFGGPDDAQTYICGYARSAFKRGELYTTGENHEAFICMEIITGKKGDREVRAADYWPLVRGVFESMSLREIASSVRLLTTGGESLHDAYTKQKKPHIFVGMVVVREKYQHMGYMRGAMEIAFAEGRRRNLPVILDTDAESKKDMYVHLGMEVERERRLANGMVLYDLIRYPDR